MAKVHKSMQGQIVDMEKLAAKNELMPAVGNIKVNARGDELGPGGKIIKKREEVMAEYYEHNPKAKANASKKETATVENKKSVPAMQPARNKTASKPEETLKAPEDFDGDEQ